MVMVFGFWIVYIVWFKYFDYLNKKICNILKNFFGDSIDYVLCILCENVLMINILKY